MLDHRHADADRLTRLIAELLDVARIDTGRLSLYPRPLDFEAARRAGASTRSAPAPAATIDLRRRRRAARRSAPTPTSSPRWSPTWSTTPIRHGEGTVPRHRRRRSTPRRRTPGCCCTSTTRATGSPRRSAAGCSRSSGSTARAAAPGSGMYIVHGLVRAHGGSVEIDDAPGRRRPGRASCWPATTDAGRAGVRDATRFVGRGPALPRLRPAHRTPAHRERQPCRARTPSTTPSRSPRSKAERGRGDARRRARGDRRGRRPRRRSSRSAPSTPATARRWRWPTGRSARCRRRPARTPASASARPAARSTRRSPQRQAVLEAEHEERMLVEETVDVTLPVGPRPARRPAPAHHRCQELHRRRVRGDGLGGRRGPGASRPSG